MTRFLLQLHCKSRTQHVYADADLFFLLCFQVSAVYSITWFPVLIIYMLNYFHENQEYGNITYITGIVIVTFNSCVNPFVYVFVNERFRNHLKRLFVLPFQNGNQAELERRVPTNDGAESSSQQQRPAVYVISRELGKA